MKVAGAIGDTIGLIGYGGLVYGCWLAWEPLGWIVGGAIGLVFGYSLSRSGELAHSAETTGE